MTIYENINRLVSYGLKTKLFPNEDRIFIQNKLLELFKLDGFETLEEAKNLPNVEVADLENILKEMLDYAVSQNFIDDNIVEKDLFDTKIMSQLVPPPSVVREKFASLKAKSPKEATDWFYDFSCNTDYIRRYRVAKDMKWKTSTEYGELDITINLSKPEKDPKAIAAARNAKQGGYPACLLCKENEGYAGRLNHPARQNHRIIPVKLNGEDWFMQYSPYVYYNEHCIVFDAGHVPMVISRETFVRLLDFVEEFPHYTIGSNADIPIVGGSILTHNHFQGGNYVFPMARAEIIEEFNIPEFKGVKCGIVNWPMSVIRIDSKDKDKLIEVATYILDKWRGYTDEKAFIFAETDGERHNTITPIARRRDDMYELDLVLRNNITTEEHPLGVYHPHAELHHIKKENIGLIEVMGLAVLPSRLKSELAELGKAMLENADISKIENLKAHGPWAEEIKAKYQDLSKDNIDEVLKKETGLVFSKVLQDAGVYKNLEDFNRFIDIL